MKKEVILSDIRKNIESYLRFWREGFHEVMFFNFPKYYTRLIGLFFIFIIFSLISDYIAFGFRPETMHKVFHILLGVVVVKFGWSDGAWWRAFPLINGAFFSFVAIFGVLFPDFGGLDAFNTIDTLLHAVVGVSGLVIGLSYRRA